MIIAMKARIYIRVGRAKRWHNGKRDKVAASHRLDYSPLVIGLTRYCVRCTSPLTSRSRRTCSVILRCQSSRFRTHGTFATEPVVVQVPLDVPEDPVAEVVD
jgi:hypothetical protein